MRDHNSKIAKQPSHFVVWWKKHKPKKGAGREFLGKLSNGLMVPIAVLPIAGLLLGIGSAILNSPSIPNSLTAWENAGNTNPDGWYALYGFASFIRNSGNFVFANLPVLFAIAVAITFTRDAGVAGFSAFVAWICFSGMQNAMIFNTPVSIVTYTLNNNALSNLVGSTTASTTDPNALTTAHLYSWFHDTFGYQPPTNLNLPADVNTWNSVQWNAYLNNIPVSVWDDINAANSNTDDPAKQAIAQHILNYGNFQVVPSNKYDMLFWKNLAPSIFGPNVGINSLQTSVFGGLIVGAVVAQIYKRTYQIQMPKILGFFSGTRFVPIASLLAMMPLAVLFGIIWPGIGQLLSIIGNGLGTLSENGGANALILGYLERALVPLGLHYTIDFPLMYTSIGGNMTNAANIVPFIRKGNEVFAIIGAGGVNFSASATGATAPNWVNVIQALNPGYVFNSTSWAGDQTLWFSLNGYLVGKEVILSDGSPYLLTYETFAQNTMNTLVRGLPAVTIADHSAALKQWSDLQSSNTAVIYSPDNFVAAFPGVNPGQYTQGKYPFMVFGLPAAGAAMIMAAPKQNRKQAASIVISAALTSFLTGITEPMEFSFLFLAPWLYYGVHAILCAISFLLMSVLGANVGQSFSSGFIDLTIYGFIPDGLGLQSNSYWAVVIGLVYIPIYYFTFYFLIKRFNLATPGRGGKLITKKEYLAAKDAKNNGNFTNTQITAYHLIKAFGGQENITAVNACITKLRVSINDPKVVDEQEIKNLGAQGIMKPSLTLLHAIFGTDSEPIKTQMNNIITNNIDVKGLEKVIEDHEKAGQEPALPPTENRSEAKTIDPSLPKEIVVLAPVSGTVKPLSEVNDKTFSDKIMGDGIAILPSDGKIIFPGKESGKVDVAFPTGHAYVLDVNGVKVMIHIGLDTVGLNSGISDPNELVAFKPHVKTGDTISTNQPLVDVDFDMIKSKNLDTITPVIVMTESLKHYDVNVIPQVNSEVKASNPLLKLTLKITK